MSRTEDTDSDCPVCMETLCAPCTLPCGHTLDGHCLLRVLSPRLVRNKHEAPCPCCRAPFSESAIDLSDIRNARSKLRSIRRIWCPTERERAMTSALVEFKRAKVMLQRGCRSRRRWVPLALVALMVAIACPIAVHSRRPRLPPSTDIVPPPAQLALPTLRECEAAGASDALPGCAATWLGEARKSLEANRMTHAQSHALKALLAASDGALRPHALLHLSLALEVQSPVESTS